MTVKAKQQNSKNYRREFFHYVCLNMASMLGLSVYILADTFFISRGMGANGLTALNLAIPIYNIIYGIGMMAGIGGAVRYTWYAVHQDQEKMDRIYMNALWFGMTLGILILILGQLIPGQLASLLGADVQTYDMTRQYLRVIMTFAPAFILNNTISAFVRNDGAPGLAMAGMLTGSLFNIVFDYILIFPAGLGFFGAALATGCSPLMGLLVLSRHFLKKKNRFHIRKMLPQLHYIRYVISLGLPPFIDQTAQGILMIVLNLMILRIGGNLAVAAYGIILNIYLVILSLFNGIAQGAQPLMTELHAKNSRRRLGNVLRYGFLTAAAAAGMVYLICYGFTEEIVGIFNSEGSAELAQMAVKGLRMNFAGVLLAGWNILLAMYFVSVNRGLPSQLVSLSRGLLVILPASVLLSAAFGLNGIWIAMPVTELVVFLAALIYYFRRLR